MKLYILLSLFVVAAVTAKQDFVVTKELMDKMLKTAKPCGEKYNVDLDILKGVLDASTPRDEVTNNFVHCFALSGGYVEEDGHVIVDRFVRIVGNHPLAADFKEAVTKCREITKENPVATTLAMNDCIVNTGPLRFVV